MIRCRFWFFVTFYESREAHAVLTVLGLASVTPVITHNPKRLCF
jgi:hypothetical protein